MGGKAFTSREAAAFAPPEYLLPSEWAEAHRILTADVAAEPGPYRLDRTPYIRGIIDAIAEATLEELIIMKAAQVAYSTLLQNLIGWIVCMEPAPTLVVMPTETGAEKLVAEQLRPLIDSCPALAAHLPGTRGDITKDTLRFDSAPIYLGWSTSAATLASRAIRFVILDETDKFPASTGDEGDPVSLARKRGSTYQHRRRLIMGCTPTVPTGHITRAWNDCGDRRHYFVPCPACGEYQRLVFGQVFWGFEDVRSITDRPKQADHVEQERRAVYVCAHCKAHIRSEEKAGMLSRGTWLSENQTINRDAVVTGERPKAKRVGFHVSALYSPWVSFAQLAAQFLRAQGNRGALQEFHNQWLGEAYEEASHRTTVTDLRKVSAVAPEGIVPKWAGMLVASADTQDDRFYWVVRAWGRDQSQLVAHGEATTVEQLKSFTVDRPFRVDGTDEVMVPMALWIDSRGHRTTEIYDLAAADPRIAPVAGVRSAKSLVATSIPSKAVGVNLFTVSTGHFKDELHAQRRAGSWHLNDGVTDDYLRHLASEVKVRDPKTGEAYWKTQTEGAANHFLDCEVYNSAGAHFLQVRTLPDAAAQVAQREAQQVAREVMKSAQMKPDQTRPAAPPGTSWLGTRTSRGNWVTNGR